MILDKGAKAIHWGKESLQQMVLGTLDIHMQKDGVELLPYTIHKITLKMDQQSKWKTAE